MLLTELWFLDMLSSVDGRFDEEVFPTEKPLLEKSFHGIPRNPLPVS